MASGVEVESPESIVTQAREEENDGKIKQCQKITEVDTIKDTKEDEHGEKKDPKVSKGNDQKTDGECFLYPPTVEKVANYEDIEKKSEMSEEVKDEVTEKPSLDVEDGQETPNEELTQNGQKEHLTEGNEETSNSSFEAKKSRCDTVNGEEMYIEKVDNGAEEILLSKIESEIIVKDISEKDIPQIGISEDNTIEADGKEITGILDSDHLSQNGNDSSLGNGSEEKETENREPSSKEPIEQDKHDDVVSSGERIHDEEAPQVSRSTEIMPSERNGVEEATTKDIDFETSEKEDEKSAEILELEPEKIQEINISEELLKVDVEMTASESDLQKSKEADSDEKEELIEDAATEVETSQQKGVQTIEQSLPESNPEVNESIHDDDNEQCSEENIETRDIPIEKIEELKTSTLPETNILEQSNENPSLDETLDSSIHESEVSPIEENTAEPTSSPVAGKIDESEESEVINEENTIEADAKEMTGISDGDLPQNENDSSLGNDSAENEDENHDTRSEIELAEQDKQERVVLSEESIHNGEAPQVSESTEFTPLEGNAKEEVKVKDINLATGKTEEEQSAEPLESEPEKIQDRNDSEELMEIDMEMKVPQSDLQKNEQASDEKELTEDAPTEVDITQQIGVETVEQSLPGSNPEVNESIDNDDKEHCTEENIESRDFPIEKIEELKRCTSPETSKLEPSNENLSLDETLDSVTQKSEASQLEEKAAEPTYSPSAEKIDESEEIEVISEENHDVAIEEDSKAQLTEESLTDSHPIVEESAENVEVSTEPANENMTKVSFPEEIPAEEMVHKHMESSTSCVEAEEKAIISENEADHVENSSQTDLSKGNSTKTTIEETPVAIEKLDSEANQIGTGEIRDVEEEEDKPTENLISKENNEDQDQCVIGQKNDLNSEGSISKAADADQEATEVENEEAQTVKQEATEENIESRDFLIEKTEELEKSNAPETTTPEQSNENLNLDETLDSSTQESEMSRMEENAAKPTTFPVAEEIDDTPQQLKAEENSSIRSTDIEGEADRPDSEHEDVIQDATEVENKETQTVKLDATEEDFQHVVEKEIIDDEEKTDAVDEDSSQQHDEKNTTKSDIGEIHVTDTVEDAEIVNREFEESNSNDSIGNQQDIEASQSHSESTNIPSDEVQLAEVQEETEIGKQLEDSEDVDSNNLTDGISAKENPESDDAVEELDSKSAAVCDDSLTSEQEVNPDEQPLSEENNEGQDQSGPEQGSELDAADPISKTEGANQEAIEVENKETQTVKDEAEEEDFQHVVEREIVDDEEKTNGADEKSSQQNNEKNAIKSDIAETQEEGDAAHNEIHGVDIVEKENIVEREFEESNSGNSIGNEEAAIEASQSHEENTNVSIDEVQLLELREEEKTDKQLEDVENENSDNIIDDISAKENPEPDDAVEKLETVTKPEATDDNGVASDEADRSLTEGNSTGVEYENDKSAKHLSNNQDLSVAGMENELNEKEVQLNGETQSLREEAIDEDLPDVASDEEKLMAANEEPPKQHDQSNTTELDDTEVQKERKAYEQSETEESQQKDNAREEESVDQRSEENISSNEEINQESIEVSPSQDEYTEISDDTNQVIEVQEEAALKEQEENLEQEEPKNIIDSVSAEEENFEGPHVDPPKQLDESASTESESIEAEPREIVNQETNSDNTIGNEETVELNQDENTNISTDGIQVIEVHDEANIDEQEEKVDQNPSIIVDGVPLEENPKQAEDIEEIECGTKSAAAKDESITPNEADRSAERVIQEEQIDNQGLSVTEVDNQLENEEAMNKGNDENQEAKGIELNEVIQSIEREAIDEDIQPEDKDKIADANVGSEQNDESSTTEIPNTEVQENAKTQEESGNEEIQGQATPRDEEFIAKTHEESGHEEIHGKETSTDEEFVDQRLEEIHSGNVTANQESTEVPPTQDECTMISDDGNQATDVQKEVALGKSQDNIEDEDISNMSDNVTTEKNPGPAEAVEKPECIRTSDAVIESTITSDEAEKIVTEEKSMVVENPDVKSPEHLLREGHTEDEDSVNNEGDANQSPEPVGADEKFDLESTTACEDREAIEGQDFEENQNVKQEATKDDFQSETVGKIGDDKDGEVACESGESNETREIDIVKDKETVNEDSNSSNAINEETIEAYPSQDENANISGDEIQVIVVQEEAKIEEPQENIEDENSSNIPEGVSKEENAKPAEDEDDIYTKTEDVRSKAGEKGFQQDTNDEEKIMGGTVESPQQPSESSAVELENTELQRDENAHEQSEGNEIHRTDKVFNGETMESNEEQNQEHVEASTSNIDDENPVPSQDEFNISNEETEDAGVPEEAITEAQLDRHGIHGDEKLDKPEGGSESAKPPEANKAEEETTNMEVNDLEATSTENMTESGNTEAKSLGTEERDIDLAECTAEKEEDAEKTAEARQINEETRDINKRESKEEDLQQTILEERTDCEVKPKDSNTDNSQLENERDISMSDEQCKSVEMDGSGLDQVLQAVDSSNEVQQEQRATADEASEQKADVEENTLSQDESPEIPSDQPQVVEVKETEIRDRECQPNESEDLENINDTSSAQVEHVDMPVSENKTEDVEEVKDDLNEKQDIPNETIEEAEKQGADSGEVELNITNTTNVEEETGASEDHPQGNTVKTLDVFSPKEIQQVNKDDTRVILPEVELENPVAEEMAENGSSQTNEQELEMKNGDTSTTEDKDKEGNIMAVHVPKEEMSEEQSLEKETQDTQDELVVSNSEFEPTKDSELKEALVEEAGKIDESSISSDQEQSESSEQALKLHGQEPIQLEETDKEMVENAVNYEPLLEENQCEMNVEARDATICDTKREEVMYMDEPTSSTHKTETANAEVTDSLHEGINASNAAETQEEQASVKESEKAENVLMKPDVREENLEEEEKQMEACYDNIVNTQNITLVKDETSSQQSHQQGNIKEAVDISSILETEQVDDGKLSAEVEALAAKEAEEVISTPQLEHEYTDVALGENKANQSTEKLHAVHTEREVMLPDMTSSEPDCQDVEEVSAADIIASQIARAIEEEEQREQQSFEQQIVKHEATELVPDMDDNTLENQVPKEENKNINSLEEKTKETYLPEERGIELEVQKDMQPKQEKVEKVYDSQMSGTVDLPSASQGTDSPSEDETSKVSRSSTDSSSQEILNEEEIKDSNKSAESSNISPQVDSISDLIPKENSGNSCTTDDNERSASIEKGSEIPGDERTISEEIDQEKHQKIIGSELTADERTVLTSEAHQATICYAATEEVAELQGVQEASQGFPYEETTAQSEHKDPLASAKSLGDDEKPAIIAKMIEILDEKVQHSEKTIESPDKVEKAIIEVEEERRTEFSDSLGSGKKAVAHGKVSPLLDIPKTQATILVPRTPEATEERKTKILADDSDSPTEPKNPQNAITVTESVILEKSAINAYEKPRQLSMENQKQAPEGLIEDRVRIDDGKDKESLEIPQIENMKKLENDIPCYQSSEGKDEINETKARSMPMDLSGTTVQTCQTDGRTIAKGEQAVPKGEKCDEKETLVELEEPKTDEEKDESVDQSQEDLEQREMPITAQALGEMELKATQKKSSNILLGVGSKVKHSISKMKKAIACSSAQFSQEDVIVKLNKNKKA